MAHDLPIDNTTYRVFIEKLGASDPENFIGNPGDIFWNPNTGKISVSDGQTPGGIGIKTFKLEATNVETTNLESTNITLLSPNGTPFLMTVNNSGQLYFDGNALEYGPVGP